MYCPLVCRGITLKSGLCLSVLSIKLVIQPPDTYRCINHLLNTHWTYTVSVFMWVQKVREHSCCPVRTACSSCLWVSLLRVERLQHLTEWRIHKSQLCIHKSVYANRHGAVHWYKLSGEPFMTLSCSKLVWNVQSSGQIAPICVCLWTETAMEKEAI